MRFIYIASLIIVFAACSKESNTDNSAPSGETIQHPTSENIVNEEDLEFQISQAETSENKTFEKAMLEMGEEEEGKLIGKVESIVIDSSKYIVLDSDLLEIIVYQNDKVQRVYELEGRGPGEFMLPEKMVWSDGFLYVIDRYNKIIKYSYQNGTIEYVDTIKVDYVPIDLCVLNDQLVVRGIRQPDKSDEDPTTLHLYSIDKWEHIRSYGEPYKSGNPLVVNQMSDGPIACNDATNSIVAMNEYFPYVYFYNTLGDIQWIAKLEDFNQLGITEGFDGRRYVRYQGADQAGQYTEVARNIVSKSNDEMIIQTRVRVRNENNARETYSVTTNTYIVSINNKKGHYLGRDIPFIWNLNEDKIAASKNDPIPKIQIFNAD